MNYQQPQQPHNNRQDAMNKRRMAQAQQAMILGKTKPMLKTIATIAFGILPIVVLLAIFREDLRNTLDGNFAQYQFLGDSKPIVEVTYGAMWGIAIGGWLAGLALVGLLIRFERTKAYKKDLIVSCTAWAWGTMGYMLMYYNGWAGKICLSATYYVVMSGLSRVAIMIYVVQAQIKKAQDMMKQMQNSPMGEQFAKSFTQGVNPDMLRQLDEQLKKQGINIDDLNKKFGDQLKPQEHPDNQPTIDVTSTQTTATKVDDIRNVDINAPKQRTMEKKLDESKIIEILEQEEFTPQEPPKN